MTEKRFNTLFNAFILIGMTVVLLLITAYKLQTAESGKALLIVAAVGSLCGILSTVCSANGKILTFLFGFFDVAIYGAMCLLGSKYGNAALHLLYFLPMQFIGFFQWRRRGAGASGEKPKARRLTPRQRILWGIIFLVALVAVYFILLAFDQNEAASVVKVAVLMDAFSTVCNILGQLLLSTAYMEQWYFWIGVNISTIIMWGVTLAGGGDSAYATIYIVKYAFYLVNSLNGLRIWYNLSREDTVPSAS